ncbi:MAG: hypothetical protein A3E01_20580 [Gammaproteobacteria bacterium RIFCSPHIGHO2_12_FULL_63_22]|nr:MAG: hypothetical protein A3E01_20580 [Gammaproteobacteria bacterium RIFCSPHIGHO2_12_FULL_63_22]
MTKLLIAFVLVALALVGSPAARAQTTDGYHSYQVFPVVVDTAAFAQRFVFKNPSNADITIRARYFPESSTSQATPLTCPDFVVPFFRSVAKASLREICPDLAAGSQFGFLHTSIAGGGFQLFAGFSRVSNPQGQGFTVETFSAATFTSSDTVVNGVRRLAATPSAPAFQTNCFVGMVNLLESDDFLGTVNFKIFNSAGAKIGEGNVNTGTGKITRLLDIFAAGMAPAGDYNDAQVRFTYTGPNEPGVIAFCTVQDNTSFGADFRIAKQEVGDGGPAYPSRVLGPQDVTANRVVLISTDSLGRPFEIDAGASANTHLLYIRNPDSGFCMIIDPNTGVQALPSYGLEIRAIEGDTEDTTAGGNNSTVVPDASAGQGNYFGDKADGDGNNSRAVLEVESNEQNTGVVRPYKLLCRSGSGMNLLDIIRYKDPVDRF